MRRGCKTEFKKNVAFVTFSFKHVSNIVDLNTWTVKKLYTSACAHANSPNKLSGAHTKEG